MENSLKITKTKCSSDECTFIINDFSGVVQYFYSLTIERTPFT